MHLKSINRQLWAEQLWSSMRHPTRSLSIFRALMLFLVNGSVTSLSRGALLGCCAKASIAPHPPPTHTANPAQPTPAAALAHHPRAYIYMMHLYVRRRSRQGLAWPAAVGQVPDILRDVGGYIQNNINFARPCSRPFLGFRKLPYGPIPPLLTPTVVPSAPTTSICHQFLNCAES
ncbi:hypothetical protein DFH27DRAFT_234065 [Peziza echinospora]|nr:hypothetical protein DFH27DRAFT_234065 [Peziza echinospora]